MTVTIYGVFRSRASRNIWLCNEMNLPFVHVPVIQAYRLPDNGAGHAGMTTQSPAFLALNPAGQIPILDDDGLVLTESLAINLYLAKKHGSALGPKDAAEDGLMTMWSFWAITEAEGHALKILYNRALRPEAERNEAEARASIEALRKPTAVLEGHLENREYLAGDRFTVADLNVASVYSYAKPAPEVFEKAPRVLAWLDAALARPAFAAARNA